MPPRELVIAVAATFTADPVVPPLRGLLDLVGVPHRVELAGYGQVLEELIDPGGLFGRNRGGINVALVRLADLGHGERAGELADLVGAYVARAGAAPLLLVIAPDRHDERRHEAAGGEAALASAARAAGAQVVTSAEILRAYPVEARDDPAAEALGHIPYTAEMFAALGAVVARKARAFVAPPYKVLALDADNTLWNGVVGEDGPEGVVVDEGRAAIQRFALAQREAGMLLVVCSKNAEADVEAVFRRGGMPLARAHLAAWRVGWQPKSESLRSLAAELGLGLDAFVLLDDSRVEQAEVTANAPEVLGVHLPEGSAEAAALLDHVWAFDRWRVTDEDRLRADLYRQNAERERSRKAAPTMAEFLAGLALTVRVEPPEAADMPRIAQLTFRTNQLNFTTVRRSEAELGALVAGGMDCLEVRVRDRFGDHGLVGVMLFEARDDALVVDTFLLSCRVLGRGVEHRMLAHLGELAAARGLARVDAPLAFTAKNLPAQALLRAVGERWLAPREGGFVVRFPAAEASALVYVPGDPTPDPSPQGGGEEKREGRSGSPPPRGEGLGVGSLETIARELRTAAAILARTAGPPGRRARPALAKPAVAPRTEVERRVAALCEEALGLGPVGVTDDLVLDLGADSFAAVRIAAAMWKALGTRVEVATVQEARTVERLAAASPHARTLPRSLHALRSEGSKRPLFLARPATRSGGALSYAALGRHLDPERPVYVLQNRPLLDGTAPYASIEAMAAEYVAAVREVQPHGPYLLAGWCLGGKTAFEMACQLAAQGERVEQLVLFDTAAPGGALERARFQARQALTRAELRLFARWPRTTRLLPWVKIGRSSSMLQRFGVLAYHDPGSDDVRLVTYAFPGQFDAAALRAMPADAMWQHVYEAMRQDPRAAQGEAGVDAAEVRRGFRYFAWDHRLDALYAPRGVFGGAVTMLVVRGGTKTAEAWRPLLGRMPEVIEVDAQGTRWAPDPHSAMMAEENVARMAGDLHRVLGKTGSP